MAKRKQTEANHSGHPCAQEGCRAPGDFRAPRSRKNLHDYQWLCEEHVREFNKKWNYFEGMGQDEIYEFQKDATHGHRPTWRADRIGPNAERRMEEALHNMFGDGKAEFKATARPISAKIKDALAVLDLPHPSDKSSVKTQYRELVKKYHPDVNRGNARAEETFKKITASYHYLMAHYVEN